MMAIAPHFVDRCQPVGPLPQVMCGAAVAIGNFDGIHRGHQAVLDFAMTRAKRSGLRAIMLTFEPHPRTLFRPDKPVFRLSPHTEKAQLARAMGMDAVLSLNFTHEFSTKSPQRFIDKVLIEALQAKHVISGYDFHFGENRSGTPDYLRAQGEHRGFGVDIVDMKSDCSGDAVSSTRIRQALEDGAVQTANRLLGYRHFVCGTIRPQKTHCRQLETVTASLCMTKNYRIKAGVYAVKVIRSDGSTHNGIARHAQHPALEANNRMLELHLFDFNSVLSGEQISVIFHDRLRSEQMFEQQDDFLVQMNTDLAQAQAVLQDAKPLSEFEDRLWSRYPVSMPEKAQHNATCSVGTRA
ncbi:riboflavin biosynthesis protein RibF [Cohaesibacter celericrescens]|uniref:Riboflavin biosynthesis protein n=1 Tax=Cohaesibacter celericrescens TaxID=2067669 RepID=A0A2N5XRJ5_9HYPH|nr:riboflavin biosynthesis protein RibF [Cohaesibacter celericrescens]PLW77114.1 riboflavin biosynthesis protein RibF [Cohaesibacter celericrescens]